MEEEQQFCLRWNNFQANITSQFEALRDEEDFVDVTLACDGQRIKAHKVVLSACSPYFKELFRSNPCKHPILFMRDVEFQHLQSLVEFMYAGEVNVAQAHLSSFLRTAESLQIRGLTEAPQQHIRDLQADSSLTATSVMEHLVKARPRSSSPQETSQLNTSSPEEEDDDDDDDDDVASQCSSTSPPPPKRAKDLEEKNTSSLSIPSSSQPATSDVPESESGFKEDSPELFEPKLEAPDYSSDGESKGGGFFGLDNSIDNPFSTLHGGLDMFPGPSSQGFTGDSSHEAAQAYHQKLHSLDPRPCPICNRMYSNLSNLRQHVRLIHNPQTVACPLCSKPFKTKLYLKRHLMSFHELQCTNPASKPSAAMSAQGPNDFFPPPQAFLSTTSSNSNVTDDKPHHSLKMTDYKPEYFHTHYNNLPNNGERPFPSHAGNSQELPTFPSQVSKEDGSHQMSDKSGIKSRDGVFVNSSTQANSEYRTTFLPQQLGHAQPTSSDALTGFVNIANEKTPHFHSTLSLSKNGNVPDYLDTDTHVHNEESPKTNKESEHSVNSN